MNKIYVGNLPFKTEESELTSLFGQFGEITEIALIRDRYSNEFKGFGFITFSSEGAAQSALSLDGKDFSGRPMRVNIAKEESKRPPRTGGEGRFNRDGGGRGGKPRSGGAGAGRGRW